MSLSKCAACGEMVGIRLTFNPKIGPSMTICLDCDDEWQAEGGLPDLAGREDFSDAEWARMFDSLRKFIARKNP